MDADHGRIRTVIVVVLLLAAMGGAACTASPPAPKRQIPRPNDGIAFPSADQGWVLTFAQAPTSGAVTTRVIGTADGGSHWTTEWTGADYPAAITALDPSHAWVVVHDAQERSHIVATTDGGTIWTVIASSSWWIDQVTFSTPSVGLAATRSTSCSEDDPVPASLKCPGEVLVTRDGGRSWKAGLRTPEPIIGVAARGSEEWATEEGVGYLDQDAHPPIAPKLTLWGSTDSGRHWAEIGTIASFEYTGVAMQAQLIPGPGAAMWVVVNDPGDCAMHGCSNDAVWMSNNQGWTWSATEGTWSPDVQCGPGIPIAIAEDPRGLMYEAAGPNLGACPPPAGYLWQYSQEQWSLVHTWPSEHIDAMAWPAVGYGYALTGDSVMQTADGGRTWTDLLRL